MRDQPLQPSIVTEKVLEEMDEDMQSVKEEQSEEEK